MEQRSRPTVATASFSSGSLGAEEENIIRYMAGYIPFKLLKAYMSKNTEVAAKVVDCLKWHGQPEDDFYAYTQEWTQAISWGGDLRSVMLPLCFFGDWT